MKRAKALWLTGAAVLALAGVAAYPYPLVIKWEGLYIDYNLRDIGASLNQCLGEPRFREGLALRANGWFSGWSCADVGSPTTILSLNYDPADGRHFFCRRGTDLVVGQSFNQTRRLADLEFLSTWDDPAVAENVCGFFASGFAAIGAGQRTLIHCDAGRDRTGTYAAILAAVAAERRGLLDERMLDAIECDYRKTRSLSADKRGRMRRFIESLRDRGGVAHFLEERCNLSKDVIARLGDSLMP